jgi:hypothetical protein
VIDLLGYVKQQLMNGLENVKKSCVGQDYETDFLNVVPVIEKCIEELFILSFSIKLNKEWDGM